MCGTTAREFLADRLHVGRDREAGQPVVVMAEHDALRSQQVGLARHEARQRALDRLAVDVAATGGGEDRDVGPEVPCRMPDQWPDVSW